MKALLFKDFGRQKYGNTSIFNINKNWFSLTWWSKKPHLKNRKKIFKTNLLLIKHRSCKAHIIMWLGEAGQPLLHCTPSYLLSTHSESEPNSFIIWSCSIISCFYAKIMLHIGFTQISSLYHFKSVFVSGYSGIVI